MINNNEKDVPISGNPQITWNVMVYNLMDYKRHTNFSYGSIKIEPTNKTENTITWNTPLDVCDIINNIQIYIDNLNDFSNIIISIDDFEPIVLTSEYIKLYHLVCNKIIYQLNSGYVITFNLTNLIIFYKESIKNTLFIKPDHFIGLPIIQNSLKINWICISGINPNTTVLKFNSVILDLEERRRILETKMGHNKKIFSLENYQIEKNNNTYWNLTDCNIYPYGFIGCVILKSNYDYLESLEITLNGITFIITKSTLELFDQFYCNIIFDFEDKKIIKIKYLSMLDDDKYTNSSEYYIKINFSKLTNQLSTTKIYNFQNVIELNTKNHLLVLTNQKNCEFTNGYYEYVNNLSEIFNFEKSTCLIEISNQINLTHIREIFIFFTNLKTNKKERISNNFYITIADITNEYTDLDMNIYAQTHHSLSNPDNQIYSIGYSLDPLNSYPNGLFNMANKPIKIEFDISDKIDINDLKNYQVNVVLFGFNVYT